MKDSRAIPNRRFSTPVFVRACQLAGIPATKRQASKWRLGKGLARRFISAAILQLASEAKTAAKVAS